MTMIVVRGLMACALAGTLAACNADSDGQLTNDPHADACFCGQKTGTCRACTAADSVCAGSKALRCAEDGCLEEKECSWFSGEFCEQSSNGAGCVHCDPPPTCNESDPASCDKVCGPGKGTCAQEKMYCGPSSTMVPVCHCGVSPDASLDADAADDADSESD